MIEKGDAMGMRNIIGLLLLMSLAIMGDAAAGKGRGKGKRKSGRKTRGKRVAADEAKDAKATLSDESLQSFYADLLADLRAVKWSKFRTRSSKKVLKDYYAEAWGALNEIIDDHGETVDKDELFAIMKSVLNARNKKEFDSGLTSMFAYIINH